MKSINALNTMTRQTSCGGRMTKWKGLTASLAAASLSVSFIALSAGLAHTQTVISTAETTGQTIDTNHDVTLTEAGSIILSGTGPQKAIVIDAIDYNSDVLLQGTIEVTASSANDNASAYGIDAPNMGAEGEGGSISNDGTIEVTATVVEGSATVIGDSGSSSANVYASAYGIYAPVMGAEGSISNDGTIEVTATVEGSATADDANVYAKAYGISASGMGAGGNVSNKGTIIVSADANTVNTLDGVSSLAVGIDIDTLDGTLINSGTVIASVANDGDAFAVRVNGGTGQATFTTASILVGRLALSLVALT